LVMPRSSRAMSRVTGICSSPFPTATSQTATVKAFRGFACVSNHARTHLVRVISRQRGSRCLDVPLSGADPAFARLQPTPAAPCRLGRVFRHPPSRRPPGRRRLAARDKMKAREGQTLGKPRMIDGIVVFGDPDEDTMEQIKRCAAPPET